MEQTFAKGIMTILVANRFFEILAAFLKPSSRADTRVALRLHILIYHRCMKPNVQIVLSSEQGFPELGQFEEMIFHVLRFNGKW